MDRFKTVKLLLSSHLACDESTEPVSPFPCGLCEASLQRQERAEDSDSQEVKKYSHHANSDTSESEAESDDSMSDLYPRKSMFSESSQIIRPVFISSILPKNPLFLIWEIIQKLQIASSSARDLTTKLEAQAREISSIHFAQRSHIVRVFGLVKTHWTNSEKFSKLAQHILG